MDDSERTLWQVRQAHRTLDCVMRSCCSGAELQIRAREGAVEGERIVLREMYPTKSDLYERARQLEQDYLNEGTA